jgi:branched-chain amino acid transport system permease protein
MSQAQAPRPTGDTTPRTKSAIAELLADRRARKGNFSRAVGNRWYALPIRARVAVALGGIAILYLLPWLNPPILRTEDTDFTSVLAGTVVPFVLLALGLNVVVGMAGLLDLGYVGFFATGAYTVGVLTSKHASLPWFLAMVISIVVSMGFGVALGAPTLRLRGDYLAIVTLGFGEIIRLTAQNVDWLGASEGISAIKRPPSIGPLKFTVLENKGYWVFGLTLIMLVVFLLSLLESSRVGRAWTAIREDEDAAELMGVPTFQFKLWAFAIGAAVGGLAGAFYAGKLNTIYPKDFEIQKSILFLAAVVLGGLGNRWGAIVGGFLVAYLPERFRFLSDKRYFFFGLVQMLMMIFRPEGLLPRRLGGRTTSVPATDTDIHGVRAGLADGDAGGVQEAIDNV